MLSRLKSIYGSDALSVLNESHVVVCGLGGVGSYCATALARGGVGKLTVVDCDNIEQSNINRQQFAFQSTIGQSKVDVARATLKDINPDISLNAINKKITSHNISNICSSTNFIVDCIDDVQAKIAIAKFCQDNNVGFVSCMGTALRRNPSQLRFGKLYNTSVCPLCRAIRQEARKANLADFDVLYSEEPAIKSNDGNLGSTSYLPPIAGMMLCGFVIDSILENSLPITN